MATPKDRYLRKSYTEGLDKVLKKAADADIEEARKETDMNIEKTGTFIDLEPNWALKIMVSAGSTSCSGVHPLDLEPNWNKVIQLAIERLGSDNKQTESNGAELIRECVKPMSEKGVDLWVEQDANVMGGGSHLLSSSDLALWADEAISVLSRDPFSPEIYSIHVPELGVVQVDDEETPGGKTRREDEEERSRATNFIKLIGDRLERNRQARREAQAD